MNFDMMATQEMRVTTSTNSTITASHYLTISAPRSVDASGAVAYSTFTGSGTQGSSTTTTIAASAGSGIVSAARNYVTGPFAAIMGLSTSLEPGHYWLGHMFSSTSSTTGTNYGAGTMFSTQSVLGLLENNLQAYKQLGASTVSNTSSQPYPFHGYLQTTTSNASSIIASSDVRGTTGRMYWNHAAVKLE